MARDVRELRGAWAEFQRHWYGEPSPEVATLVSRYWFVEWDLRGQEPYRQKIVPYPNAHLSFHPDHAEVHGLSRVPVTRVLAGRGCVFGVAFRPGGLRPFLRTRMSALTGQILPAADVFGPGVPQAVPDETVMSRIVDDFLRTHLPPADPLARQAADIVALIAGDPGLTRVDAVAERTGLGVRRLQRLFADYVGAGPKWVIRRYRLHEVGERLAAGTIIDWASLAVELDYADQAHFVRDFTALTGESPTRYAARYPQTSTAVDPRHSTSASDFSQ
jgi:AraC-like DNA-binding protein